MISKYQLFCLIILFEIGSTTLFALGIKSKQNAWMVIILAMIVGLAFLWVYIQLQQRHPEKNIGEIILELCGKYLGIPLVMLYAAYYFYISSINLREFNELVTMTLLERTPTLVLLLITFAIVLYVVFEGLEVLGRTSEIVMPLVLISILGVYLLTILSGNIHIKSLTPVLAQGPKSLITTDFFKTVNFPFGEMIAFLAYWKFVDPKDGFKKVAYLGVILSGLLIAANLIIIVSTLGVEYASIITIPLLEVIRLINIADIISNLDAVGVAILFVGGFYKISIFFYAGILTINALTKSTNERLLSVLIGVLVVCYSFLAIRSFPYHLWLGETVHTPYIHYAFQIALPLMLLTVSLLKGSYKNKISGSYSKGG